MFQPLVTVLIDSYNHERFIAQAISSVLAQEFPLRDAEILVVDDGSTDATADIIRTFGDRVRYLRKQNGGQASALNLGIREARGKIIAFLDGDDYWLPNKLARALAVFEDNPGVVALGHGFYKLLPDGSGDESVCPQTTMRLRLSTPQQASEAQAMRRFMATSMLVIRSAVLQRMGPIPEDLTFCADAFLLSLSFALGDVIVLNEPLAVYRQHRGNLYLSASEDLSRSERSLAVMRMSLHHLLPRLRAWGVSEEAISAFTDPDVVLVGRGMLSIYGGKRLETFRIERLWYRLTYRAATPGYRLFTYATLLLTLLLPPQRFYRLRNWYASRGLGRYREAIGNAKVALPSLIRTQTRTQMSGQGVVSPTAASPSSSGMGQGTH